MSLENYLRELEKLAGAATDGPWAVFNMERDSSVINSQGYGICLFEGPKFFNVHNHRYIAAANPQTIKALVKVARAGNNLMTKVGLVGDYETDLEIALKELEQLAGGGGADT